ncbi:MAG TPA: AbrB/MazE/SpoVT family DNA-binding domain-containing protein [Candidatus Acidoferrum sp.]|nr:AbrB/MazE/SpoVT family DNA-binding domain-containing protein [Candidatus Acidoferrum sp.]
MKRQARITSKGQVTMPHEIRRALGVFPGDKLLFEKSGAGFRVRPVRTKSRFAKYRGIGNAKIPAGRKAILRWLGDLRGR